jgi:hypothetical protein
MAMNPTHDTAPPSSLELVLAGYPRRYATSFVMREKGRTKAYENMEQCNLGAFVGWLVLSRCYYTAR